MGRQTVCVAMENVFVSSVEGDSTSVTSSEKKSIWDWPVIAAPTISYSPETSFAFGAAGSGYFRLPSDELNRLSELSLEGTYTLNKQWTLLAKSSLYFNELWQLHWRIAYRHYPCNYYGVGNTTSSDAIKFDSKLLTIMVQPLYSVASNVHIGPTVDIQYEMKGVEKPWLKTDLGFVAQYDKRNNLYYTTQGFFVKAQLMFSPTWVEKNPVSADSAVLLLGVASYPNHSPSASSSSSRTVFGRANLGGRLIVDVRHFIPVYKELCFAYQLYGEMLFNPAALVPEVLPQLGGMDLLRGFYTGRYRDNTLICLQGELRIPIYGILRGVVFAGIGDVYDYRNWQWSMPKVGYGVGLRLRFNKSGVNLRLDAARNNMNNSWSDVNSYSFYVTVKEAF